MPEKMRGKKTLTFPELIVGVENRNWMVFFTQTFGSKQKARKA